MGSGSQGRKAAGVQEGRRGTTPRAVGAEWSDEWLSARAAAGCRRRATRRTAGVEEVVVLGRSGSRRWGHLLVAAAVEDVASYRAP